MEIENALYRIHERTLSNDFPKLLARYFCVYFSTIAGISFQKNNKKNQKIGILTLSVFLYANIMFKDTSYCLKNSYEIYKEHVCNYFFEFSDFSP